MTSLSGWDGGGTLRSCRTAVCVSASDVVCTLTTHRILAHASARTTPLPARRSCEAVLGPPDALQHPVSACSARDAERLLAPHPAVCHLTVAHRAESLTSHQRGGSEHNASIARDRSRTEQRSLGRARGRSDGDDHPRRASRQLGGRLAAFPCVPSCLPSTSPKRSPFQSSACQSGFRGPGSNVKQGNGGTTHRLCGIRLLMASNRKW